MPSVLVIDCSASVRETLRIVLGHEHSVTAVAGAHDVPVGLLPDVAAIGLGPAEHDRAAVRTALTGTLAGVPVLFLHSARETGDLAGSRTPVDFLAKPFDAYAIRDRVRRLVAARAAIAHAEEHRRDERRWLEAPLLSAGAVEIGRRILASDVDVVLVQGEPGTGVGEVARALHATRSAGGTLVVVDASRSVRGDIRAALAAASSPATLYVEHVERAAPDVQTDLADLVRDVRAGAARTRVVAGTARDLSELAAAGGFAPELAYALSSVPLALAPLRDRAGDVPALVESVTSAWAPRFGLGSVTYLPAAMERLQAYLWFGNVAELEAVVMRTLVLHRPTVVEPEHLVFLAEDAGRAVAPTPRVSRSSTASAVRSVLAPANGRAPIGENAARADGGAPTLDLEVLVGELAHELRNPMVIIKTVAQHLDGILTDPEARARFSELMTEAVGRMDGVVETLLDFARFRAPVPQTIDLGALLDRVLDEQRDELARRQVRVERNGAGTGTVEVDEAQVQFALRVLCRGLLPSLVASSTLAVQGVGPGAFEMRVRAAPSIAARLAGWVEPRAPDDEETPPLSWALATALLARNGAALSVRKGDDDTMVVRVGWARRHDDVRAVERTEG